MQVIRPQALSATARRRPVLLAVSMLATGLLAMELTLLASRSTTTSALGAGTAAIALGIGAAWLLRVLRPNRSKQVTDALVGLLGATFDDSYALIAAPRLPIRDSRRLDGILVGPAGVRVVTARDWVGHYRVRGRTWEFDAHGRQGWIPCRTNPSYEAGKLSDGVARWAREMGLPELPMRPAVIFPRRHSRVLLEEPDDEIVTVNNAPWWANAIGRVRRLDPASAARFVEVVLDAAEPAAVRSRATATESRL